MRVEYHPAVESELREIRQYHDERSSGLGSHFIDEFERQVLALAATPERWLVELALAQQSDSRKIPGWEQNIDPPEPPPRADTSNALDSINAGFAASVRFQRLSLSFGRGWVLGFEALSRTE